MKPWPRVPLGCVANIAAGDSAPQGADAFVQDGKPFVRMQDVGRYGRTDNLRETIDRVSKSASAGLKVFPKGSILVPKSGASIRLNHRAILGVDAHVVSHLAVVTPRPSINGRFLYYCLICVDMAKVAPESDYPSLRLPDLALVPVPLPPFPEQERIVRILDKAEVLCRLRAQADKRTSQVIPSLFHRMFGTPWSGGNRWRTATLGRMSKVVTGNTPPRMDPGLYGDYIDWVKTDNIDPARGVVGRAAEGLSERGARDGRIVPDGTVLVTCIAGSLEHIGDAAIVDRSVAINQQINALVPNPNIEPAFLWQLVRSLKAVIQNHAAGVMTRIINKTALEQIPAVCPPSSIQKEFAARVAEIREMETAQVASRNRLDDLFQSLLHRAFVGEL